MNSPHYLYRAYDRDGLLLYIGCTTEPTRRIAAHKRGDTSQSSRVLAACAVRFVVDDDAYPDGVAGRKAEKAAIRAEVPLLNSQGQWRPLWQTHIATRHYLHDRGVDYRPLLRSIPALDVEVDQWLSHEEAS